MNFASIACVDGTDSGAVSSSIVAAAVELVFGVVDNAVSYFARSGASLFPMVALLLVWSIVRFEYWQ